MTQQSNGNSLLVQGRIVWLTGKSLFEGKQKTDFNTKQSIIGADGQAKIEYGFGLAIPKVDPATGQNTEEYVKVWQALHSEAMTLYPSGQIPPGFSMKFKDGDSIDHNGKPFADREGYAGHIVLACSTQIPLKCFIFENGNNILVNTGIKNGDYVNVQLNVKAHPAKGQGKPGIYLNPSAVQLIQAGKEIINTPSGDQMFGSAAPVYSGQVVADQAPQMPGQAAPAMAPQAPAMAPQAPAMAPQAPAMAPQAPAANPHYGVLPQTMQPDQGNAPVQPAAPAPTGSTIPNAITPNPMVNGSAQTAYPSSPAQPAVQGQAAMPPMPGVQQ